MLDFITGVTGDLPIRYKHRGNWAPPPFKKVFDYCTEMPKKNIFKILGISDGKDLYLYPTMRVNCWNGDMDVGLFSCRRMQTVELNVTEEIKVSVIGQIVPYGTAVSVDM